MSKFFQLTEDNLSLIETLFQETGMHNYIDLKVLGITKSKEVIKVVKTNPLAEKLGNCPDSVVCIVYEEAFDRLDERCKKLLITNAFDLVSYDSDKDKIVVGAPQITMTLGSYDKFGQDLINAYIGGIMAMQQIEDEKKEEAERKKTKKNKRS